MWNDIFLSKKLKPSAALSYSLRMTSWTAGFQDDRNLVVRHKTNSFFLTEVNSDSVYYYYYYYTCR